MAKLFLAIYKRNGEQIFSDELDEVTTEQIMNLNLFSDGVDVLDADTGAVRQILRDNGRICGHGARIERLEA